MMKINTVTKAMWNVQANIRNGEEEEENQRQELW